MKFRLATDVDHSLLVDEARIFGTKVRSVSEALVTDNKAGQRYWIVVRPYLFGQLRLQVWHERVRGEPFPAILHEL